MKSRGILLFAGIVFISLFVLWGCPKSADVSGALEEPAAEEAKPEEPKAEVQKAEEPKTEPAAEAKPEVKEEPREEPKERAAAAGEGLQPIYFDFDQAFIRDDAKSAMKANADWLKANPKVKVRIEGNCDERGTIEYNQALGQRRAASAKKYLTNLGISASRISLISYGKEKPVCTMNTEDCWQKNRRDDLAAATE